MQNTFKLAVDVCCCLQLCNSAVNMVVKGLVLGQSLMVISILLLCKSISPLLYIMRFVHKVNCLQTCEHMSAH